MTISLTISGDTASSVLKTLEELLAGRTLANVDRPASIPAGSDATAAGDVSASSAPAAAKPGRRKAPAADAVLEQKPAEPQAAMLTLDDVREHIRQFANDGHLDQVSQAMEFFQVKKTSDIDPHAGGKPSAKFAAYVAKIEEFIAAKPKGDA